MDCSYLTKQNILVYFSCYLNTHFFVWPYQNKKIKLSVLVLFINKTDRQAGRQTDSSPLFCIILCRWKSSFLLKKRISLVSTAIAMNRLTILSHLTWLPWFRMNDFTCWKWFHLDIWLGPIFHRTACSVASFGTFVSRTLPYTAYRCTFFFFFFFFFFFNNSQTLMFAVLP